VLAQVEAVRGVLGDLAVVLVSGVLCIGAEWGIFGPRKPKTLRGVTILWPVKLPELVSAPGAADIAATAAHLGTALRPTV
jgi:hypothetical protein